MTLLIKVSHAHNSNTAPLTSPSHRTSTLGAKSIWLINNSPFVFPLAFCCYLGIFKSPMLERSLYLARKGLFLVFTISLSHLILLSFQGFSVEGQENLQEILSKQLLLCQFLMALSIVRTGDSSSAVFSPQN